MLDIKYKCRKPRTKSNENFQLPLVSILFEYESSKNQKLPNVFDKILCTTNQNDAKHCNQISYKKHRWTQTDYRDSDTQTIPWEPPYVMKTDAEENCALLELINLTWEHGLPAGHREVDWINATRVNKELTEQIPPMNSKYNIHLASKILATLEAIDWAFREKEIQCVLDIRMSLYNKVMVKKTNASERKFENRLYKLNTKLQLHRNKTIDKIRHKFNRELRKLSGAYNAGKVCRVKSPKKSFDSILPKLCSEKDKAKEKLKSLNNDIHEEPLKFPIIDDVKIKPKPGNLCIKYTHWNDQKLKQLYEHLRNIRLNISDIYVPSSIKILKQKLKSEIVSYSSTSNSQSDNNLEQHIKDTEILWKSIQDDGIMQDMIPDEREKFQHIFDDFKSVYEIDTDKFSGEGEEQTYMFSYDSEEYRERIKKERIEEILNSLEGSAVSGMLDYLSKELVRLGDERRAHAFVLLAARMSPMVETSDVDDFEIHRKHQEQLDRIFHQVLEIDNESMEEFLEKIIADSMETSSKDKVKKCTLNKSNDIIEIMKNYLAEIYLESDSSIKSEKQTHMTAEDEQLFIHEEESEKRSMVMYDIFDLLKDVSIEEESKQEISQSEEFFSSTSRTYTIDGNTQTWETFEEFEDSFDEINEAHEIVQDIINNVLMNTIFDKINEIYEIVQDIVNEILFYIEENGKFNF